MGDLPPSTGAGILTAVASLGTMFALVLTALTVFIPMLVKLRRVDKKVGKVDDKLVQVDEKVDNVEHLVNNTHDELVRRVTALTKALTDKGIAVPTDRSATAGAKERG